MKIDGSVEVARGYRLSTTFLCSVFEYVYAFDNVVLWKKQWFYLVFIGTPVDVKIYVIFHFSLIAQEIFLILVKSIRICLFIYLMSLFTEPFTDDH